MRTKTRLAVVGGAIALVAAALGATSSAHPTTAANVCPHGQVNFGVEPYDSGAKFTAAYNALSKDLSQTLGCPVKLFVTQTYTAEVEAMRAGKLDIGEFGPLGYIFAHRLAKAQPVAAFGDAHHKPVVYFAGIWVPKSSPIRNVRQLRGKTLALSDPASTSGSLYPLYALSRSHLKKSDVKIKYAGGHPAALLALTHGKVQAAEVNSQQQATASTAGQFDPSKYREIWKSTPIENDPITVRADLSPAFKTAVTNALLRLTPAQLKLVDVELGVDSGPMVRATDGLYKGILAVVKAERINLSALNG
jgi:phosphonate transport system substrate-binding protein